MMVHMAEVVRDVLEYQNESHGIEPDPELQTYLSKFPSRNETDLFNLSRILEPREGQQQVQVPPVEDEYPVEEK
jgi:hypothetical protein